MKRSPLVDRGLLWRTVVNGRAVTLLRDEKATLPFESVSIGDYVVVTETSAVLKYQPDNTWVEVDSDDENFYDVLDASIEWENGRLA